MPTGRQTKAQMEATVSAVYPTDDERATAIRDALTSLSAREDRLCVVNALIGLDRTIAGNMLASID